MSVSSVTFEPLMWFECPKEGCDFRSAYPGCVKDHVVAMHEKDKSFTCQHPECDYSAPKQSAVNAHVRHTHSDNKPYACSHCDYHAKSGPNLKKHLQRIHFKVKKHSCHLCKHSSFTKIELKRHMNSHSNDGHDVRECPVCVFKLRRESRSQFASDGQETVTREAREDSEQDEPQVAHLNQELTDVHLLLLSLP